MEVIQNHSFKYQLIRDILTVMATIVIFVWIIFSYKLYWFNFGFFQHISALKSIKYTRNPLKESQHYTLSFIIQLAISDDDKLANIFGRVWKFECDYKMGLSLLWRHLWPRQRSHVHQQVLHEQLSCLNLSEFRRRFVDAMHPQEHWIKNPA